MHSATLQCSLESGAGAAQPGRSHDVKGRSMGSLCCGSSRSSIALPAAALRRSLRRVMCDAHESSRRFPYKRRQPPSKGFPVTHETEAEVHKASQLERQKARAFDFSYGEEEASTSDRISYLPIDRDSDEYWSARIITQVGLIWWSLQYSSIRFDFWLASLLHPRGRGMQNYEFHSLLTTDAKAKSLPAARRSRELHKDEIAAGAALSVAPQRRQLQREPRKLRRLADQAARSLGRLDFFQWLERLSQTYGTSFMVLVVLGYCIQGFRCFPWLAMSYYFKDNLQMDPGMMQFLISTATLPMVAKPIYGIISDSVYIRGAHRVPYLIFAGALQVLSWGAIVMHPGASSSIGVLTGVLTLSNMGAAISEVMNDALVAEAGKNKKGARQGELQSLAWLALASGGLLGNLMGGFALQWMDTTTMFSIFMMLVGSQLLLCLTISEGSFGLGGKSSRDPVEDAALVPSVLRPEDRAVLLPHKTRRISSRLRQIQGETLTLTHGLDRASTAALQLPEKVAVQNSVPPPQGMRAQLAALSSVLRQPAVLRPLAWFLSSYAVIPGLGSSMFFYQTEHLGLDSSVVGLVKVVGQAGLLAGSVFYHRSLKRVPLRRLLGGVQALLALCMLSDVLLVNRVNLQLGIPDEVFVLGASAFVEALAQFKILPFMVLLAHLCPPGSEGSLFAFFMSAQCLAGTASAYLGVGLAGYLHISATDFGGLPLGLVVQASCALLPVLWLNFIPEEPELPAAQQQPHDVDCNHDNS